MTDLIVGRYEIVDESGEKRRAIDRLTGREVVVRSKPVEAAPKQELLEKLVRLRHPRLAALLHYFPVDGELWMITESVDGPTLESLLGEFTPVEATTARGWMRGMVEAAHATHEAGLLVGDLSPSNVIVEEGGAVKVLDAGFSGAEADALGVQNELSTLAAIYRRILGESANENPALAKMEAAQSCTDFLAAIKEIGVAPPEPTITTDVKPIPKQKKPLFFRKWDRRHVIAIIATIIGIFFGYKFATHGQSESGFITRWFQSR